MNRGAECKYHIICYSVIKYYHRVTLLRGVSLRDFRPELFNKQFSWEGHCRQRNNIYKDSVLKGMLCSLNGVAEL